MRALASYASACMIPHSVAASRSFKAGLCQPWYKHASLPFHDMCTPLGIVSLALQAQWIIVGQDSLLLRPGPTNALCSGRMVGLMSGVNRLWGQTWERIHCHGAIYRAVRGDVPATEWRANSTIIWTPSPCFLRGHRGSKPPSPERRPIMLVPKVDDHVFATVPTLSDHGGSQLLRSDLEALSPGLRGNTLKQNAPRPLGASNPVRKEQEHWSRALELQCLVFINWIYSM